MTLSALDINCHFLPPAYLEQVRRSGLAVPHMLERAARIPTMADLPARLAAMDQFSGYAQVPSLAAPPIEGYTDASQSPRLTRFANEALADLCRDHAGKFPSFVASLPMNNPEAMLEEARHAITELNAAGVQIYTNINGRPVDGPECFALYELMNELDRPLWLHPYRDERFADYASEDESLYEIWWALGWPYESAVAMTRLVFGGLFDRFPDLKVITHHVGGIIPMLENRLSPGLDVIGNRTAHNKARPCGPRTESIRDAFRRFYADTASFGSALAIEAGLKFFQHDRLLFATDTPFSSTRSSFEALHRAVMSDQQRSAILIDNAARILTREPAAR